MTLLLDATTETTSDLWVDVCAFDDLLPERGARGLVGGRSVALFRTYSGELHALDDIDPFSGASVLSRGIVGTREDVPVVSSPMFKQAFDLRTGTCLDDPTVQVPVFATRLVRGRVQVARR